MRRVAVIDLGSNSLKLLVAEGYNIATIYESFAEIRLLSHKDGAEDLIPDEKMEEAIETIHEFIYKAKLHHAEKIILAGTSVFRTAVNAGELLSKIRKQFSLEVRVLSPEEEADASALGVRSDPAVAALNPAPAIFDLGGGSLEFIAPQNNFFASWRLGAVSLLHKIFPNGFYQKSFPREEAQKIVLESLKTALLPVFKKYLPAGTPIVVCGGALAVASFIHSFPELPLIDLKKPVPANALTALYEVLIANDVKTCIAHGVPPERVETLPISLLILATIAQLAGTTVLHPSSRNLRYGLAARLLR
ncbi:MAG: hypothetical protein K6B46_01945 [Opitutales bacterium]|nr:hypothetical protein [Opitutales bacterium]